MNSKDLTKGDVIKTLLIFFLPVAAGTWLQQLYNAADGVIVSRYVGTAALAAVTGSSVMIVNFVLNFFVALTNGFAVIIAHRFGLGDVQEVKTAMKNGLAFSVIGGAAIGILFIILAPWLLELLQTPDETLADSITYLRIYFSGMVFIALLNMESATLRALGDSRNPFIYMCISCGANIVLDFVFVKYFSWGVTGAAVATVMSQIVNATLLTWKLFTIKEEYRIRISDFRQFAFSNKFAEMLKIGIPSGMQSNMYTISNMILQVGINMLGTVVVASWGMGSKIDGIYWATSSAAGVAITNFIGQNYGAGRTDRIRECARKGFVLFTLITIIMSTGIMLLAIPVLNIFTSDQAVIDTTYQVMTYFVPYYFIWAGVEILESVMRGMGDAVIPVVITAIGIALFRILWMIIVFLPNQSLFTISVCYPISWGITLIGLYVYYKKSVQKRLGFLE